MDLCGRFHSVNDVPNDSFLQQDQPLQSFAEAILGSLESGENYVTSDVIGLKRCQEGNFAYIGEYIGVLADVEDKGSVNFAKDSFQMILYGIAMKRHLNLSRRINQM